MKRFAPPTNRAEPPKVVSTSTPPSSHAIEEASTTPIPQIISVNERRREAGAMKALKETDYRSLCKVMALQDVRDDIQRYRLPYPVLSYGIVLPTWSSATSIPVLDNLSAFEKRCVATWISKVLEIPELNDKMKQKLYSFATEELKGIEPLPNFCIKSTEDDNPLAFTIHRQSAAFFYDENGFGKKVRQEWCLALKYWAISNIRSLPLRFKPSETAAQSGLTGVAFTDLNPQKLIYIEDDIKETGITIARSNPVLLLEPVTEDLEERVSAQNIQPHEEILLGCWLDELLKAVDERASDGDCKIQIKQAIEKEKSGLLGGKTRDELEKMRFIPSLILNGEQAQQKTMFGFVKDDALEASGSSASLLCHRLEDNIFEDSLMLFKSETTNKGVTAFNTFNPVYEVKEFKSGNDAYDTPNSTNFRVLLPFKDTVLEILKSNFMESEAQRLDGFGLKEVNVTKKHSIDDYLVEVVFMNASVHDKKMPDFPITKEFKGVVDQGKIAEVIGDCAVWPTVEIETFSSYRFVHVHPTANSFAKVSIPNIEPKRTQAYNNISLHPVTDSVSSQTRVYDKTAFVLGNFPYAVRFESETAKGVVLLCPERKLRASKGHGKTIIIGIDYGTSNSIVYTKSPGSEAKVFDWSRSLIDAGFGKKIIEHLDKKDSVYSDFFLPLPSPETLTSFGQRQTRSFFPTMYARPLNAEGFEAMVDGDIVHAPIAKLADMSYAALNAPCVIKNPKWDEDNTSYPVLLRSLMYFPLVSSLIAAEGEGGAGYGVEFRISYPTSMPSNQLETLKANWKQSLIDLWGNAVIRFQTEALAAARAISAVNLTGLTGSFSNTMIVDIGGGSVDVAVIAKDGVQNTRVVYQDSVLFGARKILGESTFAFRKNLSKAPDGILWSARSVFYSKNPSALTHYEDGVGLALYGGKSFNDIVREKKLPNNPSDKQALNDANLAFYFNNGGRGLKIGTLARLPLRIAGGVNTNASKNEYFFDLERVIENFGAALSLEGTEVLNSKSLGQYLSKTEKASELKMFERITFAFAALFFYLGRTATKAGVPISKVVLAGNGASTIDWLEEKARKKLLEHFFGYGYSGHLESSVDITLVKPEYRKHEAALGLVELERMPEDGEGATDLEDVPPHSSSRYVADETKELEILQLFFEALEEGKEIHGIRINYPVGGKVQNFIRKQHENAISTLDYAGIDHVKRESESSTVLLFAYYVLQHGFSGLQ